MAINPWGNGPSPIVNPPRNEWKDDYADMRKLLRRKAPMTTGGTADNSGIGIDALRRVLDSAQNSKADWGNDPAVARLDNKHDHTMVSVPYLDAEIKRVENNIQAGLYRPIGGENVQVGQFQNENVTFNQGLTTHSETFIHGDLYVRNRYGAQVTLEDFVREITHNENNVVPMPIIAGEGIYVSQETGTNTVGIDGAFVDNLKREIRNEMLQEDYDEVCRENKILEAENAELHTRLELIEERLGL